MYHFQMHKRCIQLQHKMRFFTPPLPPAPATTANSATTARGFFTTPQLSHQSACARTQNSKRRHFRPTTTAASTTATARNSPQPPKLQFWTCFKMVCERKRGESGESNNNQQNGEKKALHHGQRQKKAAVTYQDGRHFGEYLFWGESQFLWTKS